MSPRIFSQRTRLLAAQIAAIAVMVTLVSFSVPLYRLFCAATGIAGTTQRVARDTAVRSPKQMTVFFNTDVAPGLPWRFVPLQRSVTLHLGEQVPAYFEATNLSDRAIVGHATFNVTPDKSGIYFKKVQCFCFNEERLAPHQTVQMPVQFYVDPRIADDSNTADVSQITLSYTFFQSKRPDGALDLVRFATAPADAGRGGQLFAAACSACHALDHNKVGPMLGHVVGRVAGAVKGYPYSRALTGSSIVWTGATLDRWLADPGADVPGVTMPMGVASAAVRRDIIAYLVAPASPVGASGP